MKALFINGSPRKNWTTAQMLEKAMDGARNAGADVEIIHLYDLTFKGCVSCLACKLKNSKTNCLCAIRDDLTPVLKKAIDADVIVMGTPVYFSYPTGLLRSFMERLMFPINSYNPRLDETTGEYKSDILKRKIATATIYTMGCTEEAMKKYHYPEIFGEGSRFLENLFGYSETIYTYNAYQFDDYSKYDTMEGVEEFRAKYRDEQYPKDLQSAYELGQRLVEKAKEYSK